MTDLDVHVAAWVASQSSPHTRDAYAREAAQWLAWCETNGVDPLTPDRAHLNTWKESPTARRDTPSPATRARRIAAVSSLYTYLGQEGVVPSSPFALIKRPHGAGNYTTTRGLTRDELTRLLDQAKDTSPAAWALVALMGLRGLRVSEARLARCEDVRMEAGQHVLAITRKGEKQQIIPLDGTVGEAVTVAMDGRKRGPIAEVTRRDGYSHPSRPYSYSGVSDMLHRLAERAGITDPATVRPHALRHSFATLSLDAGVPLRDVQDAMSHSSPATTRHYDRARNQLARHPSARLEAYLAGSA